MVEPQNDREVQEKFRVLYKDYASALIFYASKFVDKKTAEDLVQDVFLKIWNKRSFLLWGEQLPTYLYNAIRHACLDQFKRQEIKDQANNTILHKLKIEELHYMEPSVFIGQDNDRVQSIYREIGNLPEKCREIVTMSYFEERKTAEIASLLNISKRTVEAQLYKALKQIRAALHVES